ncbi:MAG: hypothetical protein KGK11_12665 [Sphingomonadales bacterium]|nr:hypothetical protein [Sphingomonadales bacterium]
MPADPHPIDHGLLAQVPPLARLALAYAPVAARAVWLGFFALDARLARQCRDAREPILAQLRLAWWRDRLGEPASAWPAGEPLLAALHDWRGGHGGLVALVDGWEHLLGEAPLSENALVAFATGRAATLSALAGVTGAGASPAVIAARAAGWSYADLALHLSHRDEREAALRLARAQAVPRLPRSMRPLAVLGGVARRQADHGAARRGDFLLALRLGITGV